MSDRSLPQRFSLPLPKPINGSFSYHFLSTTNSKLQPIGKPMPNRRGGKPLATIPLDKKHVQNLTNQRTFRQSKKNYIRSLELRTSNLEVLYTSAKNEIKTLNDRIAMLEKRLASSRLIRSEAIKNVDNRDPNTHYGGIVNLAMYQTIIDNHTIYDENKDGPCDVIMNDQMRVPITTSDERIWIASTSPTTTSPLYPTFVASNPSQNIRKNGPTFPPSQAIEPQWIQPYFSQTSTVITSNHHPLNLKWILSDAPNEE
ncbi:hypothetical protein GLOIN_2v1580086 [Rhizophagus irregularis DAOM 181602=DAOM 197198]|nr:hypothetical protein GLOIN_2v1580086 [Rhizophagus irregularis DAOM 181602=DAOM 197198]